MNNFLKPVDFVVYNKILMKRGYIWIKDNPEVCKRYLSIHHKLNFDITSLKNRFANYFKESGNKL